MNVSKCGLTEPQIYGKTWTVTHDPLMRSETTDDLLEGAGVRVLLHTAVTDVIMDGVSHSGSFCPVGCTRNLSNLKTTKFRRLSQATTAGQ